MRPTQETGILTVADVRAPRGESGIEARFNERQQIFELPRSKSALADRLREALDRGAPVKATLNPRRGVVARVESLSERELGEFEKARILVDEPQRPFKIDLARIDPTTFNIVDHYLKVPAFRLCTRVIPTYKVAKDIFDFCAAQSCNLPGPYAIPHCIPFQYVRDGCYARAHEMRRIITDHVRLLLREGLQLRHPVPEPSRGEGEQMGRLLRHLVVPRRPARPGAHQDQAALVDLRIRTRDGDRPRHVRQARAAQFVARGTGGHNLLSRREGHLVFDPARLGLHAGEWHGDRVHDRPELHGNEPDAGELPESDHVPVI